MEIDQLTEKIIGCAYRVHGTLSSGFLEKVYENALRVELELAGVSVHQQAPIPVSYRRHTVGDYYADLAVEGRVIVEIKAVQRLTKEHKVQVDLAHEVHALGDVPA